jgi:hypothetical protein
LNILIEKNWRIREILFIEFGYMIFENENISEKWKIEEDYFISLSLPLSLFISFFFFLFFCFSFFLSSFYCFFNTSQFRFWLCPFSQTKKKGERNKLIFETPPNEKTSGYTLLLRVFKILLFCFLLWYLWSDLPSSISIIFISLSYYSDNIFPFWFPTLNSVSFSFFSSPTFILIFSLFLFLQYIPFPPHLLLLLYHLHQISLIFHLHPFSFTLSTISLLFFFFLLFPTLPLYKHFFFSINSSHIKYFFLIDHTHQTWNERKSEVQKTKKKFLPTQKPLYFSHTQFSLFHTLTILQTPILLLSTNPLKQIISN